MELALQKPVVDRRHFRDGIVGGHTQTFRAQQPEDWLRGNSGLEATLLIQPLRITLLRHAITYESQTRCA